VYYISFNRRETMTSIQLLGAIVGSISFVCLMAFVIREENKAAVIRRKIISDIRKRKKTYVYDEDTDSYQLKEQRKNTNPM